eukprot:GHUV01050309.1.p1 GENE.GHUV01050309.1~~GHUV01050309.1.p1  ORF type:complete len:159 (+),score=22.87 GHUV01050309.1:1134-1610(+)
MTCNCMVCLHTGAIPAILWCGDAAICLMCCVSCQGLESRRPPTVSRCHRLASCIVTESLCFTVCSALWVAADQDPITAAAPEDVPYWHPVWGDRCQELVWIGVDMDEAGIHCMLDACLLSDAEMSLGPEGWAALDDPLPPWELGEDMDDDVGSDDLEE